MGIMAYGCEDHPGTTLHQSTSLVCGKMRHAFGALHYAALLIIPAEKMVHGILDVREHFLHVIMRLGAHWGGSYDCGHQYPALGFELMVVVKIVRN
jgi:hypothetical protein